MNTRVEPLVACSRWAFGRPVEPAVAASALREWLAGIASGCASPGGHVMGHIKAYAALPAGGCIRGNATSTRQAPDVELHEPAAATLAALEITLNVLVVGLGPEAVRGQAIRALDAVAARYGFTHSTSAAQSQGEY